MVENYWHLYIKMKGKINEEIEIGEGIHASLENNELTLKGPNGENKKDFNNPLIQIRIEGDKIKLSSKRFTKREKNPRSRYGSRKTISFCSKRWEH